MASKWATGIWKARALSADAKNSDGSLRHAWGRSGGKDGGTGNAQLGIVVNVQQPGGTKREGVVYLTFTEDAVEFSMQRLRQMGWQGTDLRDLKGIDRNYFDIDVSYERFDGEDRLRLEVLVPAKPRHKHELAESELAALALRYTDHAAAQAEVTLDTPKNARPQGAQASDTEETTDAL